MAFHPTPTQPPTPDRVNFERAVGSNDGHLVGILIRNAANPAWALQWAAWRGDAGDVSERLVRHAAVAPDDGSCALSWAAQRGHGKVVDLLIPVSNLRNHGLHILQNAEVYRFPGVVTRLSQALPPTVLRTLWKGLVRDARWGCLDELAVHVPSRWVREVLKGADRRHLPRASKRQLEHELGKLKPRSESCRPRL